MKLKIIKNIEKKKISISILMKSHKALQIL